MSTHTDTDNDTIDTDVISDADLERDGLTRAEYNAMMNGGDDVGGDDEPGDEQDEEPAPAAATEAAPAPAPAPATASEDPAPAIDEDVRATVPNVAPVDDYTGKLAGIESRIEAAGERFADAEISAEEYKAELRAINADRDALVRQQAQAELAVTAHERAWNDQCERFWVGIKAAEGIDYVGNPALMAAIDAEVKRLALDPANAQKTGGFFLSTAHANIKAAFGISAKPAAAPAPAPARAAKPDRSPDLSNVPPTMRDAPRAAQGEPGAGKWDHLAGADAAAAERAIAAMSPAELAEYMDSI